MRRRFKTIPLILVFLFCNVITLGAYAQLTIELKSFDGEIGDEFGSAVVLNDDYALVGARYDDENGTDSGSAYIFERKNDGWTMVNKLVPDDGYEYHYFGYSVALSGNRALIGARRADGDVIRTGAAYIFERINGQWTQVAKLLADDGDVNDWFGESVAIEGNRVLVGARKSNGTVEGSGSVYVFEYSSGQWRQIAKFFPNDGEDGDVFGASLSLYENRAVVGAYLDDLGGQDFGSAYIFELQNNEWKQIQKLTASDGGITDRFGATTSLHGDRVLIGALFDDEDGVFNTGSAYVFDLLNGVWQETAKLKPSNGDAYDTFGISVSLFGDQALIGAYFDDDKGSNAGAAYLFEKQEDDSWHEAAKLLAEDGKVNDSFGFSASLYSGEVLVGTRNDIDNSYDSGSAYLFIFEPTLLNHIGALSTEVYNLLVFDLIEPNQYSMLSKALKKTYSAVEREQENEALQSMSDFVDLVDRLVSSRQITSDQAQPLYDASDAIIELLNSSAPFRIAQSERDLFRAYLSSEQPGSFKLHQNHPNPFNPATILRYEVPEAAQVSIIVYDMLGRAIKTLAEGIVPAGVHEVAFDGSNLSSGTYLVRFDTPQGVFTKKMLLLK